MDNNKKSSFDEIMNAVIGTVLPAEDEEPTEVELVKKEE